MILWPISCNIKAGPTAKSITGMESNNVKTQVLNPKSEIPPKPLTTMKPSANVNAAVANFRLDFSMSLKCQILVLLFVLGLLEKDALAPPTLMCIVPSSEVDEWILCIFGLTLENGLLSNMSALGSRPAMVKC